MSSDDYDDGGDNVQEVPNYVPKNYYGNPLSDVNAIKFRQDPIEVRKAIISTWRGEFNYDDKNKVPEVTDESMRLMNEQGVRHFSTYINSIVNKEAVLTNQDTDRINIEMINSMTAIIKDIAKNKKRFNIKSKDAVLQTIENPANSSKRRGAGGFEAELSSKSINVTENIQQQPIQTGGVRSWLPFKRSF